MQFVIDETSWVYAHPSADAYCSELLACLKYIQEHIKTDDFFMCKDLFTIDIVPGKTFFDLWNRNSELPMPREIQEIFSVIADRIADWATEEIQPSTCQVTLLGATFEAPSIAWSAENKRRGNPPIACLALPRNREPGEQIVVYAGAENSLFFLADDQGEEGFARFEILSVCTSIPDFQARAQRAFKGLDFLDGVFSGIKDMSKGFNLMLPSIVAHLGVLSDQGTQLFDGPPEEGFRRLAALGVIASDENGNTKRNGPAMKQRTRSWKGRDIAFVWHTKIEPDRDRIHFFKDESAHGRIVIGIFHRHLD